MVPDLYDRKLGFGELFVASCRVFEAGFKYLLIFCIFVSVLLSMADWTVSFLLPDFLDLRLANFLSQLASGLFDYIPEIGAIIITVCVVEKRPFSLSSIFQRVRGLFAVGFVVNLYFWLIGLASLAIYLLIFDGTFGKVTVLPVIVILLMLTVMFLTVYFIFAMQAVVLRGMKGIEALRYSCRTVRGQWWAIFGKMLLLGVVFGVPFMVIEYFTSRVLPVGKLFEPVVSAFTAVFITILFLNIDRQGLKEKVEDLKHPDDLVNPACQAVALGEG